MPLSTTAPETNQPLSVRAGRIQLEKEGNEYARDEHGQLIEIVDEVAVSTAVSGARRVALTERERNLAIEKMISHGHRFREIAANIGTSPEKLRPVIESLGYELIPRRQSGGRGLREATEIRKKPSGVAV
jgi:hypothetical protein